MDPTFGVSAPNPNVIEEDLNQLWQSVYENSNRVQKVTPHFIIQNYLFLFFLNMHRIMTRIQLICGILFTCVDGIAIRFQISWYLMLILVFFSALFLVTIQIFAVLAIDLMCVVVLFTCETNMNILPLPYIIVIVRCFIV